MTWMFVVGAAMRGDELQPTEPPGLELDIIEPAAAQRDSAVGTNHA